MNRHLTLSTQFVEAIQTASASPSEEALKELRSASRSLEEHAILNVIGMAVTLSLIHDELPTDDLGCVSAAIAELAGLAHKAMESAAMADDLLRVGEKKLYE